MLVSFTFETVLWTAGDWFPKAVSGLFSLTAAASEVPPSKPAPRGPVDELEQAAKIAFGDSLWEPGELEKLAQPIRISHDDPILDQDPFYLRSQRWVPSTSGALTGAPSAATDVYFQTFENGVEVSIPGLAKSWSLDVPLQPLLATEDYLFFSARDPSLFEAKTIGVDAETELGGGVFIVVMNDLLQSLPDATPVPVFFFPLYGDAWDVDVRAHEEPALGAVHFVDAGDEVVTVRNDHIAQVIQVERGNLLIARLDATKARLTQLFRDPDFLEKFKNFSAKSSAFLSDGQAIHLDQAAPFLADLEKLVGDVELFPGRGATAGFGVLYVGYDLDHSTSSLLTAQAAGHRDVLQRVLDFASPRSAFAGGDSEDPAQLMRENYAIWRLVFAILGMLLVFSFTTRYAVKSIRQRLREVNDLQDRREVEAAQAAARKRAEKIEAKRKKSGRRPYFRELWHQFLTWKQRPKHRGVRYHLRREMRAHINNFGYTITAFDQLRTQPFGAAASFVADRYFTPLMGASRPMRKLMDSTIIYSKEVNGGAVVNGKLIGRALLVGGIDVAGYAAQLIWLYPRIASEVAQAFDSIAPNISEAMRDTFVNQNLETAKIRNVDIHSTTQDNILKMSAHYTVLNDFNTQQHTGAVNAKMIHDGLNPEDPRNAAEKKRRLNEMVDIANQRGGLAERSEFVWDLTVVLAEIKNFLGYKLSDEERAAVGQQTVMGEHHPGFIFPALKAARKHAKSELKRDPNNNQAREALNLFEETIADFGILHSLVKSVNLREDFIREASRFRRVRRTLLLLTTEGESIEPLLEVISEWSKRISIGSAAWAANVYTTKFIEIISGGKLRMMPTPEESEKFGLEAEKQALAEMQVLFEREFLSGVDLQKAHPVTFQVFKDRHVINRVRTEERIESYKKKPYEYEQLGWFGRWQKRRVQHRAQLEFLRKYGRVYSVDHLMDLPASERAAERKRFHSIYASEYAAAAGLVPDFPMSEDEIREQAQRKAAHVFRKKAHRQFDPLRVEDAQLWNQIYTEAYSNARDSIPDFEARSHLRESVIKKAEFLAAHEEHRNEPLKVELDRLRSERRYEEYEALRATQYAQSFVRAYEDSTENEHWDNVGPLSPARPGRWQQFRQRKVVRHQNPLSKSLTIGCRLLEATTNPTHRLGMNALLDRRMWGYYGFKFSVISTARHFPMNASSGYEFRSAVLKTALPRGVWVWYHLITSTMFRMGSSFAYRLLSNIGVKPMGRLSHVFLFSLAYVALTGWGSFFATPSAKWWEMTVWQRVERWWNFAIFPVTWTKHKIKCDIFSSCKKPEAPVKTDAEQVWDTVETPVFSTGDNTGEMDRMWEPSAEDFLMDAAEQWTPIDAATPN